MRTPDIRRRKEIMRGIKEVLAQNVIGETDENTIKKIANRVTLAEVKKADKIAKANEEARTACANYLRRKARI